MPAKTFTGPKSLKDFKILPESELVKLSLPALDAYYARLNQFENAKAEAEKKKRDEARLRIVERKRQEERRIAREKEEAQKARKESEKDSKQCSRSVPKLVFSCVEVRTISRPPEKAAESRYNGRNLSTSSHTSRSSAPLPQWKNDGSPLPCIVGTEQGVAYPATAHSPKIYYLNRTSNSFAPEEVAADKRRAGKHSNNEVHSYTVSKDGNLYHNAASWQPSRDRCAICVKGNLHCWRRVVPNSSRCLRCVYKRVKCESAETEDSSEEEDRSDHPSPKVTQPTKRKNDKEEEKEETNKGLPVAAQRIHKRQNVLEPEDRLYVTLKLFEDIVKESARHHAVLESLVQDTMANIRAQDKEVKGEPQRGGSNH